MPFVEPCNKLVSADKNYESFTWYGNTTWNGASVFNGPTEFTGRFTVGNLFYINSEDQLETQEIDGIVYSILRQGVWYFNIEPFIVTRPIRILLPFAGTCEIVANMVYVDAFATNQPCISGDLPSFNGQTSFFRLSDSLIAWGGAAFPSPPAYSFKSSTGDGFTLFEYAVLAGWSSPSVLDNLATVNFNFIQYSQNLAGLIIQDTNALIAINTVTFAQSLAPMTYFTITGTVPKFPAINANGVSFFPSFVTDHAFYIDPILFPNASFNGGIEDRRLLPPGTTELFFDQTGYTQNSELFYLRGVKNVGDSTTSVEYVWEGAQVQQTTVQNQWTIIEFPVGGVSVNHLERVSLDAYYISTILAFERTRLVVHCQMSISGDSASNTYQATIGIFGQPLSGTVNGITEVFTVTSHALVNGNLIWCGDTTTLPTGLDDHQIYYVINATTDTFQLSRTLGGAPINVGSGSVAISKIIIDGAKPSITVSNNIASLITTDILQDGINGVRYAPIMRNISGNKAATVRSMSFYIFS